MKLKNIFLTLILISYSLCAKDDFGIIMSEDGTVVSDENETPTIETPAATETPITEDSSPSIDINNLAAGIFLGEPNGFTFKLEINDSNAVDFLIGYSLRKNRSLHLHSDYLFFQRDITQVSNLSVDLYFGVGGRIIFADNNEKNSSDLRMGFRFPVGVLHKMKKHPFEFFLDMALLFDIYPDNHFDLNLGIGARYCF